MDKGWLKYRKKLILANEEEVFYVYLLSTNKDSFWGEEIE